jgi:phage terminase small subunit
MAKNLTKKQQVFVAEYLKDMNATRAAISAGYSQRTAGKQGYQLLENPRIAQDIATKVGKRLQKLEISADYVLENIKEVGERCMQKKWPKMVRRGRDLVQVEEVVVNPETGEEELAQVFEFDSIGALKAQELLGKYLKLFTDKVEHSGKVTLEGLVCGEAVDD